MAAFGRRRAPTIATMIRSKVSAPWHRPRERAQKLRAAVALSNNPTIREQKLTIAAEYERLAAPALDPDFSK
jgi:hypothetical protein